MDDWDQCTICFEDIRCPSCIKPCNHMFCNPCIKKWLKKNNTCPLCREECNMYKHIDYNKQLHSYYGSDKMLYALVKLVGGV